MQLKVNNSVLELIEDDITEQATDAIVNAANAQLVLGGGVAGAIRRKGGPAIQAQCRKIGPIGIGEAAITTAGTLKAGHVIHAVGPRAGEGDEDRKLENATLNALKLAEENSLTSIAFPAIGTGIFSLDIYKCAGIMLRTTIDYLRSETSIKKVVFCLFGKKNYDVFAAELQRRTRQ